MKAILKQRFPFIYYFLKRIYNSTPFYKNKLKRIEEINKNNEIKRNKFYSKVMKDVFNSNCMVHNGPFEGMKYIEKSSGSALLPKILGSYEEPIQEWISQVIEKASYETILDIGCAEGYYAAGFGMRMPNTKIIAYDIDDEARKNAGQLIELNELKNVLVKNECTHAELNEMCMVNTLIFCDIEGFESFLLDPVEAPNLRYVDLIIESHDFLVPGMTENLINRFYKTHSIKIAVDYPFRKNNYKTPNNTSDSVLHEIMNENRPTAMKYLYMESIDGKL